MFKFSIIKVFLSILCIYSFLHLSLEAQILQDDIGQIHGDFQSDFQTYQADSLINAPDVPEKIGTNNYLNLIFYRGNLTAGLRFETYQPPLQGFDPRLRGTGIPYKFISYKFDNLEVTAGNFYEQFGNGLVLRSYWDWGLGFDNSIEGFRIKYNPFRGIYLKGLIGKQRYYFEKSPGVIRGGDGEINIKELLGVQEYNTTIVFGGSFVSKFQEDDNPTLKLPENVTSFAGRTSISGRRISLMAEYAYKYNDPSQLNGSIYKPGEVLFVTTTYAAKGIGISLGAKRVDNMNFRSDRGASLPNDLLINFMPALTPQHTYRLATLYPYASQPNGEIGFQADISFKLKPESFFGGKYGTKFNFNFSQINGIHKDPIDSAALAREPGRKYLGYEAGITKDIGYRNGEFIFGDERYYRNISGEINKKISDKVKLILSYIYIEMNDKVLLLSLSGYNKMIYSHTGIVDLSWKFLPRKTIRTEIQHLSTKQDYQNWVSILTELTLGHQWSVAILDDYNYGNPENERQIHYLSGNLTYTKNTTRISVSYGKRRAGILCVGGVCRLVPATNGLTLSISSSF